jgi:hypothetical protein
MKAGEIIPFNGFTQKAFRTPPSLHLIGTIESTRRTNAERLRSGEEFSYLFA